MTTETETRDVWSKDRLMGKQVSFKGIKGPEGEATNGNVAPASPKGRKSKVKADVKIDPMLWGQPGHLTEGEVEIYSKFKDELQTRDAEFRETIYSFGEEEGEVFCLCRWLRARKYVYDDVIKMVEEATETRKEAKSKDFYPDPKEALGCDMATYFAQYPQLYSGFAKNGAPVFISKPGVLNVDAVECITTLEGIVNFHWYIMQRDFAERLRAQKAKVPGFKRFECVCILDLEHLTLSQLTSRALTIIKEQAAIDSICFPETMCKMYIVNGPRFFGATWKLIRGWLDPRTAGKIEVISDRKKWTEKLLDVVEADQLPEDYGGKGPNTQTTIENDNFAGKLKRMHTEVLYLRGHGSVTHEISEEEEVEVTIYTRSPAGAKFTITDVKHGHAPWVENYEVKHDGSVEADAMPSLDLVTKQKIPGPHNIKVKADSNGGRWTTHNFLVVFSVYRK
jgi:hypothetical protein